MQPDERSTDEVCTNMICRMRLTPALLLVFLPIICNSPALAAWTSVGDGIEY